MLTKKTSVCFLAICFILFAFIPYIEADELIKHKEIKNKNIDVKIPYIVDKSNPFVQKTNKDISETIMKQVNSLKQMMADTPDMPSDRFSYEANYNIEFNKNKLISLTIEDYIYSGGAHGMPYKYSYVLDLKTNAKYDLRSIFEKNFDYAIFLNKKINHIISKKDKWNGMLNFTTVEESTKFYLTHDTLVVHFSVYELGPYVIGSPHFEIPLSEVREHLNPTIASRL